MIDVQHLTKWYGRTLAVDDISFHVEAGSVVGFLGPNGAGKSTTLRILTCFQPASSGSAKIDGYDVFSQSIQVRSRIGYMPENVPVYPEMRVREYLQYRAALRGIPRSKHNSAIDKVLEDCWLSTPQDMSNRRQETLSRGYRQRVGLADCLLHDPPVLVLDEPTIGLDPAQVREMRNLVLNLGQSHTVILSSHILAEVEQVCKRIIIVSSGKIVAQGTPQELRQRVTGPGRLIVEMRGASAEQLAKDLAAIPGVQSVEPADAGQWCRLAVQSREDADVRAEVAAMAAKKGYQLRELRREVASLEDFFVQITYEQSMRQRQPAMQRA